ncbi:hypothetical protein LCGC14_1892090 [marine sediment metagenome]|uniref:Uncharacterized protein n=1 Tax=marine sediment metagenome TaxID=412755 RepID=A0A0F9IX78_9ZZZZ
MTEKNEKRLEIKRAFIREDEGDELSLIDIKAAIAQQNIPISELFNKQDISTNRNVIELIHDAETKVRLKLENEIVVLKSKNTLLQKFRDKAETSTLVDNSKELANKSAPTVNYIRARLSTGRGVDMSGDLTDEQRQEKVNDAIKEELALIEEQGIEFKQKETGKKPEDDPDFFKDDVNEEIEDMTDPDKNPLINK